MNIKFKHLSFIIKLALNFISKAFVLFFLFSSTLAAEKKTLLALFSFQGIIWNPWNMQYISEISLSVINIEENEKKKTVYSFGHGGILKSKTPIETLKVHLNLHFLFLLLFFIWNFHHFNKTKLYPWEVINFLLLRTLHSFVI